MVKIKICGVTSVSEALEAAELGADAVGLNFHAWSPRHVSPDKAAEIVRELPPLVEPVAVFVKVLVKQIKKAMSELGLRTFQLYGEPPPDVTNDDSTPANPGKQITAEEQASQQEQERLRKGDYNLNDFRKQFAQMAEMGGMGEMMKMMPGMGGLIPEGEDPDNAMNKIAAMIDAMSDEERSDPDLITAARHGEISQASGTQPADVREFLVHFEQVRTMMRQMAGMSMWQKLKMITGMGKAGVFKAGPRQTGIFPKAVHPLRFIPAFSVRDRQSLQSITAYLEKCTLLGQLPAAILVDAHVPGSFGGTGQTLPWELLADFSPGVPLILAGGLSADNVARAIRLVRPYAVDVASGVESSPGKKDAQKMKKFIDAVRQA